ncbi:hypothetical protein [Sphaerisporangium aureirubrum]|uniref:XRE family transcriptional regulator n=1 Tax=Sphaerisporangium aureirubrum TaxID=1544736 RepID=A0ABW1NM17_9ACTN
MSDAPAGGVTVAGGRVKTPNLVLRRVREEERHETREEFARALVAAADLIGEHGLACDARLIARWEDGEVGRPRPAYQRALEALTGRAFDTLGFRQPNAIEVPSPDALALERLSFYVEEGQMWARLGRRTFLVGSTAALLAQVGPLAGGTPALGEVADPYGFTSLMRERWPELKLSRPSPDYGVDLTALFPAGRVLEGSSLQMQFHDASVSNGRALASLTNLPRWTQFSRTSGRALLVGADLSNGAPRFFALDAREARRRLSNSPDSGSIAIPTAYELDDFSLGLLWACASLDGGLQADDQDLALSREELSAYEKLSASAVSREAAPELGSVSHMWLGSEFCARHILRNLDGLPDLPVFWTREQRGEEACAWLLFDHKYAYLRAVRSRTGEQASVRMFCIPRQAVDGSPHYERILLFLSIALMEATGIHVKVCDDPSYSGVEGFVLGGQQAIIANWVRGAGMWHVDTTNRPSVLREFREASGEVGAYSVIESRDPARRMRSLADYLALDWAWLQTRCQALAQVGSASLLRPRSRLISVAGIDVACTYINDLERAAA